MADYKSKEQPGFYERRSGSQKPSIAGMAGSMLKKLRLMNEPIRKGEPVSDAEPGKISREELQTVLLALKSIKKRQETVDFIMKNLGIIDNEMLESEIRGNIYHNPGLVRLAAAYYGNLEWSWECGGRKKSEKRTVTWIGEANKKALDSACTLVGEELAFGFVENGKVGVRVNSHKEKDVPLEVFATTALAIGITILTAIVSQLPSVYKAFDIMEGAILLLVLPTWYMTRIRPFVDYFKARKLHRQLERENVKNVQEPQGGEGK